MRKTPARYFLGISLLLLVGGCWDDTSPVPPPMVLNSDPDYDGPAYDGPATDVVPVVGDLGGPVDTWGEGPVDINSGGDDGHVATQIDKRFITFAGFTLPGNSSPDNPPSTIIPPFNLTLGGSTDNPPPPMILEDTNTDVVPVIGDLGGPLTDDFFGSPSSTNGPPDDGVSGPPADVFVQLAYNFNLLNEIMAPYSKITFSQEQLHFVQWNIIFADDLLAFNKFYNNVSAFLNLVIATTPVTPLAFPRQDGVPTSMIPGGDRPFGGGMYERPGTNIDGGPKADIAHPATGPTAISNTDRKNILLEEAKTSATTGPFVKPSELGSTTRRNEMLEEIKTNATTGPSGTSAATRDARRQELLDEAKVTPSSGKASDIGSGRKQELLESSKGGSFNSKNSLEEKSFKNSIGEKSSRSTFTGDKVFSQQGSKSFAPLGGKTFSGTGTRAPTSGKSFKLPHGF